MGLTSTIVLKLGTGTDPSVDTGHTVTTRAKYSGDAALLTVSLYQGATFITGVTHTLTTGFADYVIDVDPEHAALITDYSDLRVWLTGSTVAHPAGTATIQVSWIELAYPEADGTQGLTVGLTQNLATTFGPTASGGSVQYLEPATAWNVDTTYSEEYGESYGGGGPTVFAPSFDRPIDLDVALKQQLVTAFGPSLKRASDIDPALAQQLVTPFTPGFTIDIPVGLAQQLLTVFEDLLLSNPATVQGIAPARKQQLVATFTPTLSIPPQLVQQLLTVFADLTITRGTAPLFIAPALQQRLVTVFAPAIAATQDITPGLAQQLVSLFDEVVIGQASGPQQIVATRKQQLVVTFPPGFTVDIPVSLAQRLITSFAPTFGVDVTPALAQQLVAAVDPTVAAGPLGLYPAAVVNLAAGHDPTLVPGVVDIAPALKQTLTTTFGPEATVSFGTIILVQQLITAYAPTITLGETVQVHFYLNAEEGLEFEPDPVASFGSESVPAGSTGVGMGRE